MNSQSKQCPNCAGKGSYTTTFVGGHPVLQTCPQCMGTGVFSREDRPEPEGVPPAVTQAARRSLPVPGIVRPSLETALYESVVAWKAFNDHGHIRLADLTWEAVVTLGKVRDAIAEAGREAPEGNTETEQRP